MVESFPEYYVIQHFEADFHSRQIIMPPDVFSVYLKTIDHLNLILLISCRQTASFRYEIPKFRNLETLNFHPCKEQYSPIQDTIFD